MYTIGQNSELQFSGQKKTMKLALYVPRAMIPYDGRPAPALRLII